MPSTPRRHRSLRVSFLTGAAVLASAAAVGYGVWTVQRADSDAAVGSSATASAASSSVTPTPIAPEAEQPATPVAGQSGDSGGGGASAGHEDPAQLGGAPARRFAEIPRSGNRTLVPAPPPAVSGGTEGKVRKLAFRVEDGTGIDPAGFADFVLKTVNDPRGWAHDGFHFVAVTDEDAADSTVIVASPDLSQQMCRPLETMGTLSCRNGKRVVFTSYRWLGGQPEFEGDVVGYRRYVVNHELGHSIGHGHEYCAGPGRVAPVMMQQTKGLLGCRPNSWPYP